MTRLLLLLETSDFFQFNFIALKHGYNKLKKRKHVTFSLISDVEIMHKQLRHKLSFLKQIIDNFHEPCKILTSHRQVYFHPKQLVDCNTHKLVLDSLQILFSMTGMLFLEVYGHHHHHLLENTMGVMKLKGIGQAFFLNLKNSNIQCIVHS